jgi:serine protease AprX
MSHLSKLVSTALAAILVMAPHSASAKPAAHSPKVDRAVREALAAGEKTHHVIITVQPGFRDTLRKALSGHGDSIKSEHPLIDALAVEIHGADVDEIAKQPWVLAVSADAPVHAKAGKKSSATSLVVQPSQTTSNTLRETLGLPAVATSDTPTGATGVGVAIIDSGIAPNDDFMGRIVGFYDFTRGGIPTAPFDDYGHGTHVAGLIGSSGKLSNYQYQGIAPDVKLVGLKVLDRNGVGKTSDVIRALEYVTANRSRLNVHIVNLSLGHPVYAPAKYDPLVQAVEKASAAGLIVVVSAGNAGQKERNGEAGYTGISSPGNAPSAITVGAVSTNDTVTRADDAVASFSSRGPTWFDAFAKPDVLAPGHGLPSDVSQTSFLYKLMTTGRVRSNNGQELLKLSGSSMSAAVATGVVALVLQKHNQNGFHRQRPLTANLVKGMLQYSAIPLAGADRLTQGAGEINAAGAIALAGAIDTHAGAGHWWLAGGVAPASTIGTVSYPWGQDITWNGSVLTGDLLYVSSPVWTDPAAVWGTAADGDNIVWGTNAIVEAANIVWGTNNIWGTNLIWPERVVGQDDGDNIVWGTDDGDNIVWGTLDGDNIVWGTNDGDNIVWGTWDGDNIVWGTSDGDNIVWGTDAGDNIVWGTSDGDNIVWGTLTGKGSF